MPRSASCSSLHNKVVLGLQWGDRLIQWGGWHQLWMTSDEKTKLARVTVDFPGELDDQFSVNISKRLVTLSMQLQEGIRLLAEVARKDSRRKYQDDGRPEPAPPAPRPGPPVKPPTGGPPAPTPIGNPPKEPTGTPAKPTVPVRPVRTTTFAWKIAKGMTGSEEIQISESETDLQALIAAVGHDPAAMDSLTGFLKRLDKAGVQKVLMNRPGA